jgi:ABC-type bacteriocin/lantibiotic exporter with double-glycine peptidase domain
MMGFIKRNWTAKEADEWTKEDTLTIIISPLIYVALMIGCAMSVLLIPLGFIILAAGIILLFIMIYIINPKLSAISEEYEKKQKQDLTTLDKKIKWEE